MKLFFYNDKDQQLIAQKDMGNLTEKEVNLVNSVFDFLEQNSITDGRYKNLILADNIETTYYDDEPELIFHNAH